MSWLNPPAYGYIIYVKLKREGGFRLHSHYFMFRTIQRVQTDSHFDIPSFLSLSYANQYPVSCTTRFTAHIFTWLICSA